MFARQFDNFSHGLRQLDPERIAHILVGWLLSGERNLGEAARGIVSDHHGAPLLLEFDSAALALSENDMIVLAHRAIGYLFIHPVTAASMVLSLVPAASAKARQTIEDVLFEPLLINFSGELANWLKAKAADGADPMLTIERLLARLDAYLDGLRRVGRIKELRPSERERLIESRRQQEFMRQVHKEAEKKSIFMSIATRSVLLYGNRSISYFRGQDGRNQRNEMKLHSFSHSIEAPRLDVIEPFDLDYTLRVFRAMKVTS